jgi:hypothetical protein
VDHFVRIRGRYGIVIPNTTVLYGDDDTTNLYPINGPPIHYGSRFGTALCALSDLSSDGIPDLAVTAIDSSGSSTIYLLFLNAQAQVLNYTEIASTAGMINAPSFSGFGNSIVKLPHLANMNPKYTNFTILAIGAPYQYEPGSLNIRSGFIYLLFLEANGKLNHTAIIEEHGNLRSPLPYKVISIKRFLFRSIYFHSII